MIWGRKSYITICLIFILTLSLSACSGGDTDDPALAVTTTTVKTQSIPVYVDIIGTTKAISTVNIMARVSGFLVERNFIEGDYVKEEQLLYVIDKRPFEADLMQARANLGQKIANMIFQEKEFIRMKQLIEKAVISQEQFDSTQAQIRESAANVLAAKAQVETAKLNLGYASMYSPIEGRIGQTEVNMGNYVNGSTNTKLATIVTLNPMYVIMNPSNEDYAKISEHMGDIPLKVEAKIPNTNKSYEGTLNFVNNEVDKTTSTVTIRATIDNPKHTLLPGLHVDARVFISTNPSAILIPQAAVLETQGNDYVFVIGKNNKAEVRPIKTSGTYDKKTIVDSGLQVGDKVITNNTQLLKPGTLVKPMQQSQGSKNTDDKASNH